MTPQEMAVAALREVNAPVAAALEALGGELPAIGLLGWLPDADRLDACRAVCLAHECVGTVGWDICSPVELSELTRQQYCDYWVNEYEAKRLRAVEAYEAAR